MRGPALNLHTPGGFVEYRRELLALHEQGIEPDNAFFEQHDIFDVDPASSVLGEPATLLPSR